MAKELVEGKYYSAPVGLVRQAFADGYLDEGTDFIVGISVDSNMCPTYWFGDGMDVVDTDDALDAIAEGLGLQDESITAIPLVDMHKKLCGFMSMKDLAKFKPSVFCVHILVATKR